jgi:transposase
MCFNQINSCAAAMKPEREIDLERLPQLPSSELVKIVVQQQLVIEQLKQEVVRLKASLQKDSTTSSKPPSTDLLKKPEKPL